MLILISPAKSLDFETSSDPQGTADPEFVAQAAVLMKTLKGMSAVELSGLMHISEKLGELNAERNRRWKRKHDAGNAKASVYAFQGDVYQGLDVRTLTAAQVRRCQKNIRILSGLYGVLRPMDWMQPYRLEMGSKLVNDRGKNLYDFWGDRIGECLSRELVNQKRPLVVNLASQEYAKAARLPSLDAEVIQPEFKDWKNGQYKLISFFAKRARGLMARYLIKESVTDGEGLQGFDYDGYAFNPKLSKPRTPVFTRRA